MQTATRVACWILSSILAAPAVIRLYVETLFGRPPLPAISSEAYNIVGVAFVIGVLILLVSETVAHDNRNRYR